MRSGWILVVEDDWFIGDVLRLLLTEDGYAVTVCRTGAAALAAVAAEPPVLAVLDWQLGTTEDGVSVLHQLRSQPGLARLPVVLWSANPDVLGVAVDSDAAPIAVLEKPALPEPLLATVRRLMETTPAADDGRRALGGAPKKGMGTRRTEPSSSTEAAAHTP